MKTIVYKGYEIYAVEDLAKTGDNTSKLLCIRNIGTNNDFTYVTKVSGTIEAIENIDNDKKYLNAVSYEVYKHLDQGIEIPDTQIVVTTWTRDEQKNSGIFYTPRPVVEFIFDILSIFKTNEDKKKQRWESHESEPHYPSVIDPAAGGGDFLKVAIQKGFTKTDWVFGMDIDETAVNRWKDINLLQEFGGDSQDLQAHFFHQNGLDDIQWGQHTKNYKYKLKKVDIKNQQFDTVVGNPPYGGLGLNKEDLGSSTLIQNLSQSEILPKEIIDDLGRVDRQLDLFGASKKDQVTLKAINRLNSFPIEVLFVERFINLAKPGGWIAMIIPDGILTNSNLSYVREFISRKCTIEAVISLPRDTFKAVKTNAKTSIIILKKNKDPERASKDYPIFLASVDKIVARLLNTIVSNYNYFYNSTKRTMDNNQKEYTTRDETGKELVMVRVDKTTQDLMSEKPFSRWDPEYWCPKFEKLKIEILNSKFSTKKIDDLIYPGTDGITYGQVGRREYSETGKVQYLQVSNIRNTGVDYQRQIQLIDEGSYNDPQRSRLKEHDLLLVNGGVGSIGRCCVFDGKKESNISQDIDRIRFVNPNHSYYCAIFLNSKYGQMQIKRYTKGVSGQIKFGFDHVRSIIVPLVDEKNIIKIKEKYREMLKGENTQEILNNLISQVEELIRGEIDIIV